MVDLAKSQPVVLTLDAIPNQELKGTILSIGQTYSENKGDIVYEVTILLIDTNPAMRWGMTTAAKFWALIARCWVDKVLADMLSLHCRIYSVLPSRNGG